MISYNLEEVGSYLEKYDYEYFLNAALEKSLKESILEKDRLFMMQ